MKHAHLLPPQLCPKCDGEIDAQAVSQWGNGAQSTRFAPYICGWCASFFMLDLEERNLCDPVILSKSLGIDVINLLKTNAPLWKAVEDGQAKIRALPNGRPVLR